MVTVAALVCVNGHWMSSVGFHDFDHDGALDLYVANGAVQAWGPDEAFKAKFDPVMDNYDIDLPVD